MDFDTFLDAIHTRLDPKRLSPEQIDIITYTSGPMWIVAGPGSGKTEVLTLTALKKIMVDGVPPKAIMITTFTNKAARNIRDRIFRYARFLYDRDPSLEQDYDLSTLRIGTLHSLCEEILKEYRYANYENYRLMDDIQTYLFTYDHARIVNDNKENKKENKRIWDNLYYLFSPFGQPYIRPPARLPSKRDRTYAAITLFNRLTEDLVDIERLSAAGGYWSLVADAYNEYSSTLDRHGRSDFASVQKAFLSFLRSPQGVRFLIGDGSDRHPGLQCVFVDEYQDTNPIQEAIYLTLSQHSQNLIVVGDDDQALYRFRGATVDGFVTFDRACERYWEMSPDTVSKKYLNANYRSHPTIIAYYNDYIRSFDVMRLPDARVAGKPDLVAKKSVSAKYPPLSAIRGGSQAEVADRFGGFVNDLLAHNIIEKPNQCALLMYSVRANHSGPFEQALRRRGIPVYNPRAGEYLDQQEVAGALGALVSILDPGLETLHAQIRGRAVRAVEAWVNVYQDLAERFPPLGIYVDRSVRAIQRSEPNQYLNTSPLELLWKIYSQPPFSSWKEEPGERTYRLSQLTQLLEAYSSTPLPNRPGTDRGRLRLSSRPGSEGRLSQVWLTNFYYALIHMLASNGMNDPEDQEFVVPDGSFPIMTIHQAKGLEFDIVFLYGLTKASTPSTAIYLEDSLEPYREVPRRVRFTPQERADQDLIRLYYVADSRAKYAIVNLVPDDHMVDALGYPAGEYDRFTTRVGVEVG
ncbi:MAG TPA: ATP-dependent helicase [Methanoregulaceae archaeon]|nr:ATP-dependent helicase [Methanoregulaceae archaeon]